MALRKGHGNGKGVPRIETLPPDELPEPVPAVPAPPERKENGQIATSEAAKEIGRRGGLAKAGKLRFITNLGLKTLSDEKAFAPYEKAADSWVKAYSMSLAQCAGGVVGPGPAICITAAGRAHATSIYFYDLGKENSDLGLLRESRMSANDAKAQLAMAFELAVREAKARGEKPSMSFADFMSSVDDS